MLRFYYVIIISIPLIIYYIFISIHYYKNADKYDEEQCYRLAQKIVGSLRKRARIS